MMNEIHFQNKLVDWYAKQKRALPFRMNKNPYSIWLCEIMAQQTQIATMLEYHKKFLAQWPTVFDLAEADEEQVLKAWQGLGYYSRARNLHKTARIIAEEYNGKFPQDPRVLVKLPGIGKYTAGAIASIAFDVKTAAVDGNVLRILSRLYDLDECIDDPKVKKSMESLAESLVIDPAGEYNQAIMDLGAMICIPKSPKCNLCPIESECLARKRNTVTLRPVRAEKKAKPAEEIPLSFWTFIKDGSLYIHTALRNEGLLSGLYHFDLQAPEDYLSARKLKSYRHVFTHKIWNIHPVVYEIEIPDDQKDFMEWNDFMENCPVATAYQKALKEVAALYGKA